MKLQTSILVTASLLVSITIGYAQQPSPSTGDTWSNVTPARDDRYTNPKSKLYSGPNGWYNFGEVRADVSNAAKTHYGYKGGFQLTTHEFSAVDANKLQLLTMDFGTDEPAVGVYQVSSEGNTAQKKVRLSFADVSDQKLRNWTSENGAGTITLSRVNGFLYVKCRSVKLAPTGLNNTGDLKEPMTLGFEGALAPE